METRVVKIFVPDRWRHFDEHNSHPKDASKAIQLVEEEGLETEKSHLFEVPWSCEECGKPFGEPNDYGGGSHGWRETCEHMSYYTTAIIRAIELKRSRAPKPEVGGQLRLF